MTNISIPDLTTDTSTQKKGPREIYAIPISALVILMWPQGPAGQPDIPGAGPVVPLVTHRLPCSCNISVAWRRNTRPGQPSKGDWWLCHCKRRDKRNSQGP